MRSLLIRNLKTGKEYPVSGDAWDTLVAKGFASRFTIVEERVLKPSSPVPSFVPDEVKNLLGLDIEEAEPKKEQPAPVRRGKQRDHAEDGR